MATDVDRTWGSGDGAGHGPVTAIAAWLTRSDASGLTGEVPQPPAWLDELDGASPARPDLPLACLCRACRKGRGDGARLGAAPGHPYG